MYTFSSKLKAFSFILMIVGVIGIGVGFMSAPKTVEEVEQILSADHGHDTHANEAVHHGAEAHDAHATAEHKEHLEHVLHQLQNKPWAAFYVACIFLHLLVSG